MCLFESAPYCHCSECIRAHLHVGFKNIDKSDNLLFQLPRKRNSTLMALTLQHNPSFFFALPFSNASICSCVKEVLFLCNLRFSCKWIWESSRSWLLPLCGCSESKQLSSCWQLSEEAGRRTMSSKELITLFPQIGAFQICLTVTDTLTLGYGSCSPLRP